MQILLAGYNVDSDVIAELTADHTRDDVTPETISAAYARISRNPKPVNELRKISRQEVAKAKKSNKTIIFSMGHHSVAEHAVFNFDIIDVSRLAIEELEHFRLCSYTEKSQRYIKLEDHYVVPSELEGTPFEKKYKTTVRNLQNAYQRLYYHLYEGYTKKHQDSHSAKILKKQAGLIANEDARYILSLATMGQLGMTANARNVELIIRRFASHPFTEIREIGKKIYELVYDVAPSIILFTDGCDFDRHVYSDLSQQTDQLLTIKDQNTNRAEVVLTGYTENPDTLLLGSLLYRVSSESLETCLKQAKKMNEQESLSLVRTVFQHAELYDSVLREFEFINIHWDLIVSASCFAQLKRHRLSTLSCQDYNPDLGVTVPPSLIELGCLDEFMQYIEISENLFNELSSYSRTIAPYILTNAHRRRVHFGCNAREFYHLSRLREDQHAQWDIRFLVNKMHASVKPIMPFVCLFLGGKDNYPEVYEKYFGRPPKVIL